MRLRGRRRWERDGWVFENGSVYIIFLSTFFFMITPPLYNVLYNWKECVAMGKPLSADEELLLSSFTSARGVRHE